MPTFWANEVWANDERQQQKRCQTARDYFPAQHTGPLFLPPGLNTDLLLTRCSLATHSIQTGLASVPPRETRQAASLQGIWFTDSRLRRPAPADRRAHRNRRTTRRFCRAPADRRPRFRAAPADRGGRLGRDGFGLIKIRLVAETDIPPTLPQTSRQRATWPTPDDAQPTEAIPHAGAPFLRAGAPAGGCRNTATARPLAIRRAAPWFSATRADGRRSRLQDAMC
jgi:hypothetical protein